MEWPKDSAAFGQFIADERLFARAEEHLRAYLRACSEDNPYAFEEFFRADLETVERSYPVRRKIVALNKNYCFDPPQDYLTVQLAIDDSDGDYVCSYTLCLDLALNFLDEMMGG